MKVLHLTDLHIDDPIGFNEALREGLFEEYLSGLVDLLENECTEAIVVTGDLVNFAKTENYPHVAKILEFLTSELNIIKSNVFLANGNHDMSKITGDLTPFFEMSSMFGNKIEAKGKLFFNYPLNDNFQLVMLDSIGNNYEKGTPVTLKDQEIQQVVDKVKSNGAENVIVLSHHLPTSYQAASHAPFDEEPTGELTVIEKKRKCWNEKHIWKDGGHLLRRLSNRTVTKGKVFWLGGDIHRPEFLVQDEKSYVIATGSLNTYKGNQSAIPPQARLIDMLEPTKSKHYEYRSDGHNNRNFEGEWVEAKLTTLNLNFSDGKSISDKSDNANLTEKVVSEASESRVEKSKYELIKTDLNSNIFNKIKDKGLYSTGQFETCQQFTALSWINVKDLLSDTAVYNDLINEFRRKINEQVNLGAKKSDILILGVDTWGAIMAARLGAATNIRSCSLAVRGEASRYDEDETDNNRLRKIVSHKTKIIVITDVIATGSSLKLVTDRLKSGDADWQVLSVICDPSSNREKNLSAYQKVMIACDQVKMPFIETEKLPDPEMLNRDISFVIR